MADVDGAPVLDGNTLYVSSFKNQTMAIEGPTGRRCGRATMAARWRGGVVGQCVRDRQQGGVFGLDKASGATMWSQTALARRS